MTNIPKIRDQKTLTEIINSIYHENGKLFWKETKGQRVRGREIGTVSKKGYLHFVLSFGGKSVSLKNHHVVWFLHTGSWPSNQIDHVDRNKLNNHPSNLRLSDNTKNAMNRSSHKNTSSKYKGVSWNSKNKNWNARIYHNNCLIHLGTFTVEEDAAMAYDNMVVKIKPEGSYLNFPERIK